MKTLSVLLALGLLLSCAAGTAETAVPPEEDYTVSLDSVKNGRVPARTAVHDPSVIEVDGVYYIFGSHMMAARSEDLRTWKRISDGYSAENPVWGNLFASGSPVFAYAGSSASAVPTDDGGFHVWAPDPVYNPVMGKYMLYYCTSSTWNASNLCFGVSDTVEGPYTWQASLICSGFDMDTLAATNVLSVVDEAWVREHYLTAKGEWDYKKWPNAIDPAVFFDAEDRMWMVYGSWSGGIFILELDPATGLVLHPAADEARGVDPYFGKHLMGGSHQSMEGPFILYDPDAQYYYLFVSYGGLNREGGYQIRVFRSREPDGDYEDMKGTRPGEYGHARCGLKLSGNYHLPSDKVAYMATGHNSAFIRTDGRKFVVYHTRFDNGTENFLPMAKQYALNAEAWPCLFPYSTWGETLQTDWTAQELTGRYYAVRQGTAISAKIAEPFILYLRPDGTVGGEKMSGTWRLEENSYFIRLTLNGQDYSGVVGRMPDDAGTEVTFFSAVGGNESIWGVMY